MTAPLVACEPPCPGWGTPPTGRAPCTAASTASCATSSATSSDAARAAFSRTELQLIAWLAEGRTNVEIAALRCRSVATVRNQLHQLYGKLGARTRGQAVALWRDRVELMAGR
jgi:DNA-binding CsgD family transcriptional regulator